jgi:hypothetical protein
MPKDENFVRLTPRQITFLMEKFQARDADAAVESFVEFLVYKGQDPQQLKLHVACMMARENN